MPTPNTRAGRRRARIDARVADRLAARQPNLQLVNNSGKGAFNVGGMPRPAPTVPNFLPYTPGFMNAQGQANDALTAAEGQYGIAQTMIPAQLNLQRSRINTDMGVAKSQLDENLAERGVYGNGTGIRTDLMNRHVATPFGRQYQDVGFNAAAQYADAANQYGAAQLGYNQSIMDALQQRAADVYSAQPLGMPVGGYTVPNLPAPNVPGTGGGGRRRERIRARIAERRNR